MEARLAFRALRHRNFQLFFGGQLISLIGTWMQQVAQSWLVYRMTGSAVLLGFTGFAQQIPVLFLSPLGGTVADQRSRRQIVIVTQISSMLLAFALAALTLSGTVRVPHILILASLLGVVNAFDIPARQSFIVEMVGREDLMNAIALNSSMFNGARIIGPALAGITLAAIGEGWCFFANGVSYIAVIASLLLIRTERHEDHTVARPMQHLLEGFHFIRYTPPILALLLLLGLVSLMGMPYVVLMPIIADRVLRSGSVGLGWLMGAAGIGALMGALSLAFRKGVFGLGRWVVMGCAGFGVSLILFSMARSLWVAVALLVPVGFSAMVQTASSNTLIQAMVPDRFRGRVMAAYSMMLVGMAPFGALLAGGLADRLGAPATVALGGFICLLGATVFANRLPRLRVAGRLLIDQQMHAGEPSAGVLRHP